MNGVTAVIPTWNRRELLVELLERLRTQRCPPQEVIVVDNGSTDGSAEAAEGLGARVLRMGQNAGFCRAVNRGIAGSRTDRVAILNNDVSPAPDWLERLLHAEAWFATGKLLDARRSEILDGTFDLLSRGGCAWRAGHGRPDGPDWSRPQVIQLAPFTAALFRRELFDKVGLLDERFESYLEDVEFGLRCARAGVSGLYVPEAVAYHLGSATLGAWHSDTVRRIARNQLFLVAKHYPRPCRWPVLVGQMLWGGVALRHGGGVAYLRGKAEGLRRWKELRETGDRRRETEALLKASEQQIYDLQQRHGFDWYWRAYFALT